MKNLWKTGLFTGLMMTSAWAGAGERFPLDIRPTYLGGGEVYADCSFLGEASRCLVDTGATVSSVRATDKLKTLPAIAKDVNYTSASGASTKCSMHEVPLLSLGSHGVKDSRVMSCPAVDHRTEINILGLTFLGQAPFRLSYQEKYIEMNAAPSAVATRSFERSPVGHMIIPVGFGRRVVEAETLAMLDTGAALTVVDLKFALRHPEIFEVLSERINGYDSNGVPLKSATLLATMIQVGEKKATVEYVMGVDLSGFQSMAGPEVNVILGHNVLKHMNLFIDYDKRLWAAE